MFNIIKKETNSPITNPFTFDPDTQAGERVIGATGRYLRQIKSVSPTRVDYAEGGWDMPNDIWNIHQLPDGRWVLGRDPALVKAKKPPTYTLEQVKKIARSGDLFEDDFGVHLFRMGSGWLSGGRSSLESAWQNIDDWDARRMRYLGNHTLALKVGGPVRHPTEGE